MASYIQNALTKDEKIIYEGKASIWAMTPMILMGFILLPLFGFGLIFWLAAFLRYISTEVAYTNKRVIAKFGFISRRTIEINIKKIESIQVEQGIFGRLFNYGSLVVSGAGSPQAPIPGISNPMSFRNSFQQYMDDHHDN
jgi:uncharacterized membrane protein YdbT with pleckstrin-like domain